MDAGPKRLSGPRYQLIHGLRNHPGTVLNAFDESDESVVERWAENPYWQFFCRFYEMQHECPIEPASLSRWRKHVGAECLEKML